MAAVILEQEEDFNERFDNIDDNDGNTQEHEAPQEQDIPQAQEQEPEAVPDKYTGKSLEDVVRMHQEAEKLLGRQSSEVGDLRSVVDSYINTQLNDNKPQQAKVEPEEDIDFYSDPEKAISRAIENHPSVRAAEESTRAYKQQTSMALLKEEHPDIPQIVNDPKFAEWIQASKIRTRMFVQADQHFDIEAAQEIFSLWKDRSGVINQTLQAEKAGRQKAVKEGSTGYTRGNPDSSASKKIYRRTDLINLMKTDPDRYLALSDEITLAYREKRVK